MTDLHSSSASSATPPQVVGPHRALREVALDVDGRLDEDVLCICEYNLRSLPPDGKCPECGRAIAAALLVDHLALADKRWVRTLSRSAWLILFMLVVLPLTLPTIYLLNLFFITLIAFAIMACGIWGLAKAEPGVAVDERLRQTRWVSRASAMLTAALLLSIDLLRVLTTIAWQHLVSLLTLALGCVAVVCFVSTLYVAAAYARRLSVMHLNLQLNLRVTAWAIIASFAAILAGLIQASSRGSSSLFFLGVVVLLFSYFWTFLLMSVLAPELYDAARARSLPKKQKLQ